MSKRSMVRLGILLWVAVVGAAVYFYIQNNMTAFYIAVAVAALAVVIPILIVVSIFAKEGMFKEWAGWMRESREDKKVTRQLDREDRRIEAIERRYEPKIEKLEDEIRALEEYLDAKALTMTESQRIEKLKQLEAMNKRLEELEKEADDAKDVPLEKKLQLLREAAERAKERNKKV